MRVTDQEIKKYKTLDKVKNETYATLGCGGCRKAVIEVLTKENKKRSLNVVLNTPVLYR